MRRWLRDFAPFHSCGWGCYVWYNYSNGFVIKVCHNNHSCFELQLPVGFWKDFESTIHAKLAKKNVLNAGPKRNKTLVDQILPFFKQWIKDMDELYICRCTLYIPNAKFGSWEPSCHPKFSLIVQTKIFIIPTPAIMSFTRQKFQLDNE